MRIKAVLFWSGINWTVAAVTLILSCKGGPSWLIWPLLAWLGSRALPVTLAIIAAAWLWNASDVCSGLAPYLFFVILLSIIVETAFQLTFPILRSRLSKARVRATSGGAA